MNINTNINRSAPGKVILCGEHSVVYGRPAIAVPISNLRAYATVETNPAIDGLCLCAQDLNQQIRLHDAPGTDPLYKTLRLVLENLSQPEPNALIDLQSDLPIASGMGSGASVTVAIARALSAYLGNELSTNELSALTYEVEKIHHGTPSGIDNTVIAWEKPVYFIKGQSPEVFNIRQPFHLLIANSGIAASTREAVADVRRRWEAAPDFYNMIFDCMGTIAKAARTAVENGELQSLGTLLNENHQLLAKLGVSLPELDQLIEAALEAGALGAKLTGSGQGGNTIALVEKTHIEAVSQALTEAGAAKVWHTQVGNREQ